MKAFKFHNVFLFPILCLCFIHCSKDKQSDQDLDDEDETKEICVPELNSPANGAELDNGCSDGSDPVVWLFDWDDCENPDYHIVVKSSGDPHPIIDEFVYDSEYIYNNPSMCIADTSRTGWTWKVRVLIDGEAGEWSEEREFSVEPSDSDCEKNEDYFTDPRDGNVYKTFKIGDQVWMAENLRSTVYSDASAIPLIEDAAQWEAQNASGAYCWYGNNIENKYTFGALYNFYAVMNGEESSDLNPSGVQGVCPSGWHLPSDDEWKELEMYLGMSQIAADDIGWRGTSEGSKLAGQIDLWNSSGELIENAEFETTNFSAVPAGHRNPDNSISDFADLGMGSSWWTATESYARDIHLLNSNIYRNSFDRRYGFSVRCVRND